MDEQAHRYTRLYGNIGCIAGLIISGLMVMSLPTTEPQLKLLLVAGVLLGAGIGMVLGRRRDKRNAAERDAQDR